MKFAIRNLTFEILFFIKRKSFVTKFGNIYYSLSTKKLIYFILLNKRRKNLNSKSLNFYSLLCLTYHIYIIIILALLIILWNFCFPYLKGQYLWPDCFLKLQDIINFMPRVSEQEEDQPDTIQCSLG